MRELNSDLSDQLQICSSVIACMHPILTTCCLCAVEPCFVHGCLHDHLKLFFFYPSLKARAWWGRKLWVTVFVPWGSCYEKRRHTESTIYTYRSWWTVGKLVPDHQLCCSVFIVMVTWHIILALVEFDAFNTNFGIEFTRSYHPSPFGFGCAEVSA